jgi:copper homeostasis protein
MKKIPVEICINADDAEATERSVRAAYDGGADRIELCSRMDVQGLTPAVEHIRTARQIFANRRGLLVMIRPRAGDFCYSQQEIVKMCGEIEKAAAAGADGVVLGAVKDGRLDLPVLKRLLRAAYEHHLAVTFHRAFDSLEDPLSAVQTLIDFDIARILTSGTPWGSASSAIAGAKRLRKYAELADNKIEIVISGGVSPENIPTVLEKLPDDGLVSVHAYSSVLNGGITDVGRVRSFVDKVSSRTPSRHSRSNCSLST